MIRDIVHMEVETVDRYIDEISRQKIKPVARKLICRYGPGCTHSLDSAHREKFWHPHLPKLNGNSSN